MIFHNKTVAIIGPAQHIETIDQKKYIESFDVVCRINEALPVPLTLRRKTSSRCDVLYIWRRVKSNRCWQYLKEIRLKTDAPWTYNNDSAPWVRDDHWEWMEKIVFIDPKHFFGLKNEIKTRPNTGLMAICDIMDQEPKMLYITGLTFYQTGKAYYRGYVSQIRNEKITSLKGNFARHSQDEQLDYFIKNFYGRENVKCDEVLEKICQSKQLSQPEQAQ